EIVDDVPEQVVRHRPWRGDVLDLQRDGVRLEDADPDRQHALPVLVAQDDDRHVGDGVDHQTLDGHFDLHGIYNLGAACAPVKPRLNSRPIPAARPQTLCGPARSIRTTIVPPIHSEGPGRFTTTFVLVLPDSSVSWRRRAASTSTSTSRPINCAFSPPWISRCSR